MPELVATSADFELARIALLEITDAGTIGDPLGFVDEGDGVVTVHLASLMRGYPDWRWTVSIAHLDDAEPTVVETELTPGEGALLAPAWVPWDDRLADQKDSSEELDERAASDEDSDDDDSDDIDSDDEGDDDEDAPDEDDEDEDDPDEDDPDEHAVVLLHAGDLDGVDIDEIDDTVDDAGQVDDVAEVDDAAGVDDASGHGGPSGSAVTAVAEHDTHSTAGPDPITESSDLDEEDQMTTGATPEDDGVPDDGVPDDGVLDDGVLAGGDDDVVVPADEVTADSIPSEGIVVDGIPASDLPTEDATDQDVAHGDVADGDVADEAGSIPGASPSSDEGLRGSLAPQ